MYCSQSPIFPFFRKIVEIELFASRRPFWMSITQIYLGSGGRGGGSRLPPPTAINPDTIPLGSYETKMAARTGKRAILKILRKNRGL